MNITPIIEIAGCSDPQNSEKVYCAEGLRTKVEDLVSQGATRIRIRIYDKGVCNIPHIAEEVKKIRKQHPGICLEVDIRGTCMLTRDSTVFAEMGCDIIIQGYLAICELKSLFEYKHRIIVYIQGEPNIPTVCHSKSSNRATYSCTGKNGETLLLEIDDENLCIDTEDCTPRLTQDITLGVKSAGELCVQKGFTRVIYATKIPNSDLTELNLLDCAVLAGMGLCVDAEISTWSDLTHCMLQDWSISLDIPRYRYYARKLKSSPTALKKAEICLETDCKVHTPKEPPKGASTQEALNSVIASLYANIQGYKDMYKPNVYTAYLLEQGLPKIATKFGETAVECVVAALQGSDEDLVAELSDLLYHVLVLQVARDIPLQDVLLGLEKRVQTTCE